MDNFHVEGAEQVMDPLRRLRVAIEVGSVRAFVGEEVARRADLAYKQRVEGEDLLEWIENGYEPVNAEDAEKRDRLIGFVAYVRSEGGFDSLAAKLREDLGIAPCDEE